MGLTVQGKTLPELFENAAYGMLSILLEPAASAPEKKILFHIRSHSMESLLVDWLQEILYYFTTKKIVFSRFEVKEILPFSLDAVCYGGRIDVKRHRIIREIKAVTHHDLKIVKNSGAYSVRIICDI